MNARLADGTTTGDLVLQQAEIIPQTQHFFDFSHGQSLLGHSVSPLARGEIPIGCPAPLSAPTQKLDPETSISTPVPTASFIAVRIIHIPGISIHMPVGDERTLPSGC